LNLGRRFLSPAGKWFGGLVERMHGKICPLLSNAVDES